MNALQGPSSFDLASRLSTMVRFSTCIDLPSGQALALDDIAGYRLRAQFGTLWVTESTGMEDIILRPGEERAVKHAGRTVITAMVGSARIALTHPHSAGRVSPAQRIAQQVKRALRSLRDTLLPRPTSRLIPEA